MKLPSSPTQASPPKRGRPAKLSHQAIITAALSQLAERPLNDVTFATVAKALGVSTMSLYSYFPQREALLDAMTDAAFSLLVLPPRGQPWRDFLRAWLWAVERHFQQYPEVAKVLGWDGRVPAAWLRVTVPVIDELKAQGLAGKRLVLVTHWFMSSAVGLMLTEVMAPAYRQPVSLSAAAQLSDAEQASLQLTQHTWSAADREHLLALGFEKLLDSLTDLLSPAGQTQLARPRRAPGASPRRT